MSYRNFMKGCIILQSILLVSISVYQTSLLGGITPGVYEVHVKANPVGTAVDEWVFLKNGNFSSTGLKLEGEWEDTKNNGFKIKIEDQVKDGIEDNLSLLNLTDSHFTITIKKLEIEGISSGNSIKGTIESNLRIKLKKPVKTSFSTMGSLSFNGELNQ